MYNMHYFAILVFLFSDKIKISNSFDLRYIVGGESVTSITKFPWQASLWLNGEFLCGAVIIHQKWALTAAHCTEHKRKTTDRLYLVAGRISNYRKEQNQQQSMIDEYYQHKNYDRDTGENDISLLKLATPLRLNSFVNVIPFSQTKEESLSGCYITGWGSTRPNLAEENHPFYLQKASVSLISDEDCQSRLEEFEPLSSLYDESTLCAWTKGTNPCMGDSGGPLVCQGGNNTYLVGLASWVIGCAGNNPAVYTNVTYYYDWIKNKM